MKEVSSSNVTERDNSPRQLNKENVNGDKRTGEQGSSLPVSVSRDLPELSQFTSTIKTGPIEHFKGPNFINSN